MNPTHYRNLHEAVNDILGLNEKIVVLPLNSPIRRALESTRKAITIITCRNLSIDKQAFVAHCLDEKEHRNLLPSLNR